MNKWIITTSILAFVMISGESCKRTGCTEDVLCVSNYDEKAEKSGDCTGCTTFGAVNYCPEADVDNGTCVFVRKFYSDVASEGWIDVWVSDSVENASIDRLQFEGRITKFPVNIPECESTDSTLDVIRVPGEYYFEIETQTGHREWGWVLYRPEGCRLQHVY